MRVDAGVITASEEPVSDTNSSIGERARGADHPAESPDGKMAGDSGSANDKKDDAEQQAPPEGSDPKPDTTRGPNSPRIHPSERNKLFGSKSPNLAIPTEETKVVALVVELRRLDLKGQKGTPLAVAFLLRALIELSDRHYRKANRISEKTGLATNVKASADHMLNENFLDKSQHDIIQRYAGGANTLMQIENLQKMLHRESHVADYSRLNTFWDELGCFIRACWTK